MKSSFMERVILALTISIALFLPVQSLGLIPSWKTYIIEEQLVHGEHLCGGDSRSAKTASLRTQLNSDGWDGWRYIDENSWPQDLKEKTLKNKWKDDIYGDARRVVIFSGHGYTNCENLAFSTPYDGECDVNLKKEVRLGTMAGDEATLVIMMTCCIGDLSMREINWGPSKVNQVLAFADTASYGSDTVKDFYNCTNSTSNRTCWRNTMDNGRNSPTVFSRGSDAAVTYNMHYGMKMKTGAYMYQANENLRYAYISMVDNIVERKCHCVSN